MRERYAETHLGLLPELLRDATPEPPDLPAHFPKYIEPISFSTPVSVSDHFVA